MKRKTCKILTFFVLIMLIMNIQLEVFADPPAVKNRKYSGLGENDEVCIEWASYEYKRKLDIEIRTNAGHHENASTSKYPNFFEESGDFEMEQIIYSGDIFVGEEIAISFNLNRDPDSDYYGKKFVPWEVHDANQIYIDKSINLVNAEYKEKVNDSFDIYFKAIPLVEGDIIVDVVADDDYKTVTRVILKVVKNPSQDPNQGSSQDPNQGSSQDPNQNIDYWKPSTPNGAGNAKFATMAGKLIGSMQVVGSVVSVAILVILGIKYMCASLEEKASYKQSMVLYVVGCIMVFGVVNIVKIIYDIAMGFN